MAKRSVTVWTAAAVFVLVMLVLQVGPVRAQTPASACASDSLYLVSPDVIDLVLSVPDPRFESNAQRGLTISWPNLDLNEATCFSLKDTTGLDFEVDVTGGFGDNVDRVFNFTSPDSGVVGGIQPQNLIVTWQNDGPATYGNVGGKLNLSNNGGIWRYGGGSWTQVNNQIPQYWLNVNTVGLDAGSGNFMVAGFSRGVTSESNPVGLFTFDGSSWQRIAYDLADTAQNFDEDKLITDIAVSPLSNDRFAVGTARDGLFITTDGGLTFTQWTTELDPGNPEMPTNFSVGVVEWSGDRVFVSVRNFGLFISSDNGATFGKSDFLVPNSLDLADSLQVPILPAINDLSFHPTDANRIAAAIEFHGAYESKDGGLTWQDLYGDLVVPDDSEQPVAGLWVNSGLDLIYDDVSPETMVLGVKQKGLYRSIDGGLHWVLVGDSVQPDNRGSILNLTMGNLPGSPGNIFVLEDNHALLHSSDSGATWAPFASQPVIDSGYFLLTGPGDALTMGSYGGGIYTAGTSLHLSDTYTTITTADRREIDLGLDITFGDGILNRNDFFQLVCQTFQGWAVWRGQGSDPEEMSLLGLFDRVNPEDCMEGYCGDTDIQVVPNCYKAKRAACFLFLPNEDEPDTIRFFDQEIYNGFSYNYSVTSFDYGNTALTTPENNTNGMLFSPRFENDLLELGGISLFPGVSNQQSIQINEPIAVSEDGFGEIYVFPNPLRVGAGIPGGEGSEVTFTNIPDGSKLFVFSAAGDRIIDLEHDPANRGNIHWDTRNSSGEPIVSGVYLYKVEIPQRDSYWGRLVVIQ